MQNMSIYVCKRCNKVYTHKNKYTKHINRKFPCRKKEKSKINSNKYITNILNNTDDEQKKSEIVTENNIKCPYCSNSFSQKSNLYRHLRDNCRKNKDGRKNINSELLEQKKITNILEKKYEEIKKEIEQLKGSNRPNNSIVNNSNNNINSNNTNNITNNITIVAHGKENIDNIDAEDILQALKAGLHAIPKLAEMIHFNDKYPENRNIYISNMSRSHCNVYDGNSWVLIDIKDAIADLYLDKYNLMGDKMDELYDRIHWGTRKSLNKFIDYHNKDDKFIKKIHDNLKRMLYNNRNKINK